MDSAPRGSQRWPPRGGCRAVQAQGENFQHSSLILTAHIIISTQDLAVQIYTNRPPIDGLMERTIAILNLDFRRRLWMRKTVWEGRPYTLDAS